MINKKNEPFVHLRRRDFLLLWVGAYITGSLLLDVILNGMLQDIWDIDEGLGTIFLFIAVTGAALCVHFGLQAHLLGRLFRVRMPRWILYSVIGWGVGLFAIYVTEVHFDIAPENDVAQGFRLAAMVTTATVIGQWWLLRRMVQAAWWWIAVHVGFLGLVALLIGQVVLFGFMLFTSPEYGYYGGDDFLIYKLVVLIQGVVTGLTVLWLHYRTEHREKSKIKRMMSS